ncbi:MAG: glycoside hydrolase family protein, partial [Oscillospiraceae bacterium]|nr:glycoside hydrolase family protein [Oscillospiraceae bacterium]
QGEDGLWHMFASRWPKTLPFHPGWGIASEIVRAVADKPEGPYRFAEVVLPTRGAGYWDGRATHNPVIQKCGDTYVLFYTGITYPFTDPDPATLNHYSYQWLAARASKRIGIATAKSVYGPWQRADKPVLDVRCGHFDDFLTSNPAPCLNPDGSCLLVYKTRTYRKPPYTAAGDMFSEMKLGVAYAEHYTKPFYRLSNKPLFDTEKGIVEDPFIWRKSDGTYAMIAKDWAGTYTGEVGEGVYADSADGIHWNIHQGVCGFTRDVLWQDGKVRTMGNMDRPFLLFDKDEATHLFVATNNGGEAGFATLTKSWNACIPLK